MDVDNPIKLSLGIKETNVFNNMDLMHYYEPTFVATIKSDYTVFVEAEEEVNITIKTYKGFGVIVSSKIAKTTVVNYNEERLDSSGLARISVQNISGKVNNYKIMIIRGKATDFLSWDNLSPNIAVGQYFNSSVHLKNGSIEEKKGNLEFTTANSKIVQVGEGYLIGIAEGETDIQVKSKITGLSHTVPVKVVAKPAFKGKGTEEEPFIIATAKDLYNIRYSLYSSFIQTTDIDLTNEEWEPIGDSNNPFEGIYLGQGHTISNLKRETKFNWNGDNIGLFSTVYGGLIRDVFLKKVFIHLEGEHNGWTKLSYEGISIGALVGSATNYSIIRNCHFEGNISVEGVRIGGIIGSSYSCTVSRCSANGEISGLTGFGGIIGISEDTEIADCFSNSSLSILDEYQETDTVGQIVGIAYSSRIKSCWSIPLNLVGKADKYTTIKNDNWDYIYTWEMVGDSLRFRPIELVFCTFLNEIGVRVNNYFYSIDTPNWRYNYYIERTINVDFSVNVSKRQYKNKTYNESDIINVNRLIIQLEKLVTKTLTKSLPLHMLYKNFGNPY